MAEGAEQGIDDADLVSVSGSVINLNTHNTANYKKTYDQQVKNFSKAHETYEKASAKGKGDDDMVSEHSHLLNAPVPKMPVKDK